ncbi:Carnitine O-acetyltransferase mitochondrial [Pleurotus pulmonarius]|nr:Carnitine O-acetyltransferase mitochondrial [Pleurotus pulmonarius]
MLSRLKTARTITMARRSLSSAPPPSPAAPVDPAAPPMLRFQAGLPTLPVPSLPSTLSKYLETLEPVTSPADMDKSVSRVSEFRSSAIAQTLQDRLLARASKCDNWLSEWWNEAAYMGYRDPVVVFVSYFFVHADDPARANPTERAAAIIKATLAFRAMVESQTLEPERAKTPLCMASYKWMFHASRYPTIPSDTAHKFDYKLGGKEYNHFIVMRNNRFFVVPLADAQGNELSGASIQAHLDAIVKHVASSPSQASEVPIGAFTSDNRDNWTHNRAKLIAASPENEQNLVKLESSLLTLCLDSSAPTTREDISWQTWVGNGRNRWYDKHQFIVYENGRSGFLGEHSCMDGTPTLRLNEFVLASLARNKIDLGPSTPSIPSTEIKVEELVFKVNKDIETNVKQAEARFDKLVGEHEMAVLHNDSYGKSLIKSHKVSPDAWAQLVKQLAFFKLTGRNSAVTYESCQTRKFKLGRTEVIRSASKEAKDWVKSMDEVVSSVRRAALFRKAATRHLQYAAWAADGQGVDRHLFGLRKSLLPDEPVPSIFTDPAFGHSSHWELSTSQLSSPYIDGWGYGEVVPDGFGLSYAIGDDYIRWTITCLRGNKNGSAEDLKRCLAEAANDVKTMMEEEAREKSSKL